MSIVYHSEKAGGANSVMTAAAGEDLFADFGKKLGGCFKVLGGAIELCATVDLTQLSAEVEIKVLGQTVASETVSRDHPCATLEANPSIGLTGVEIKLNICIDTANRCLTADGKACLDVMFDKKCATLHKQCIVHF